MERQEVKSERKWRVEDIFPSDEAWEQAYDRVYGGADFTRYAGKLNDKDTLLKLYRESDELYAVMQNLACYANLKHDQDTRVSKYSSYNSKIDSLYSKWMLGTAFYEPEMASYSDDYLKSLIEDARFSDYDYQLLRLLKQKAHVASEEAEKLVALAMEPISSFIDIFGMLDNADLPRREIEFDGVTQKLTNGLYNVILRGDDRAKREEAYKKYYDAYLSVLNTLTTIYYGSVKRDVFLSRVYKFDSSLDHALFMEDVDKKVYEKLLECVNANLGAMHRYIADRKKILGYDKLHYYDNYAPLVEDVQFKLDYEEAFEYVVNGLGALGEQYQALLKKGHDEHWLDVEETEGKRNGAYSCGVYGVHPYVLLNYQPTISDVFTIAHEMGHSIHSYFSQKTQPFAKCQYKIFVAEVASTVNEVLLLKYMLAHATDVNFKKYLLNYHLDSIRATLFRQTMFAEFEYKAHSLVESGVPLTRDVLCETYEELGKKYYGAAIESDEQIASEWCRVPHFYQAFYVYKYSTGMVSAINIANNILSGDKKALDNYFKFLSGGGSTDPVSLLKIAGVNLEESKPFEIAIKEFEDTLTELEKLMGI